MDNAKEYYWFDNFGGVNGPDRWSRLQELRAQNIISDETELCVVGDKDWLPYKINLGLSEPASECSKNSPFETTETGAVRKPLTIHKTKKRNLQEKVSEPAKLPPAPPSKLKRNLVICSAVVLLVGIACIYLFRGDSIILSMGIPGLFSRPIDLNVEGSVFIVTKNGNNIKLGLVPIKVCESHALYIPVTLRARCAIEDFVFDLSKERINPLLADYKSCVLKLEYLDDAEKERAWWRFLKMIKTDPFATPQGIKAVLTDADGKFKFHVVTREKCVLVATGKRTVFDQTEKYLWIVPLTLESQQTVILSNHNMVNNFDDLLSLIYREEKLLH